MPLTLLNPTLLCKRNFPFKDLFPSSRRNLVEKFLELGFSNLGIHSLTPEKITFDKWFEVLAINATSSDLQPFQSCHLKYYSTFKFVVFQTYVIESACFPQDSVSVVWRGIVFLYCAI